MLAGHVRILFAGRFRFEGCRAGNEQHALVAPEFRASVWPLTRYSDEEAAALYNLLNPWGPSDNFYLAMVMEATSVLDVGCGTGALLQRAREAGHTGRLCGVDPDDAA
jgi:SAM-dependent methyltransferase